jgi:hypothetical protein
MLVHKHTNNSFTINSKYTHFQSVSFICSPIWCSVYSQYTFFEYLNFYVGSKNSSWWHTKPFGSLKCYSDCLLLFSELCHSLRLSLIRRMDYSQVTLKQKKQPSFSKQIFWRKWYIVVPLLINWLLKTAGKSTKILPERSSTGSRRTCCDWFSSPLVPSPRNRPQTG